MVLEKKYNSKELSLNLSNMHESGFANDYKTEFGGIFFGIRISLPKVFKSCRGFPTKIARISYLKGDDFGDLKL